MKQVLRKTGFFLCGLMVMGLVVVGSAQAITFTTAQNQFLAGTDNQGWWSTNEDTDSTNTNYGTGSRHRGFFTFDSLR